LRWRDGPWPEKLQCLLEHADAGAGQGDKGLIPAPAQPLDFGLGCMTDAIDGEQDAIGAPKQFCQAIDIVFHAPVVMRKATVILLDITSHMRQLLFESADEQQRSAGQVEAVEAVAEQLAAHPIIRRLPLDQATAAPDLERKKLTVQAARQQRLLRNGACAAAITRRRSSRVSPSLFSSRCRQGSDNSSWSGGSPRIRFRQSPAERRGGDAVAIFCLPHRGKTDNRRVRNKHYIK
jgi:hypothetical protein